MVETKETLPLLFRIFLRQRKEVANDRDKGNLFQIFLRQRKEVTNDRDKGNLFQIFLRQRKRSLMIET